jgi:Domain of unknown function (DUF4263)
MDDERSIHFNKRSNKTYVSPSLNAGGRRIRIASKVIGSTEGQQYATERGELVIRVTPGGRQEVIAKFTEDDRHLFVLTFQRWSKGAPYGSTNFSFVGEEIDRILEFIVNVKKLHLPDSAKINITDEDLRRVLLSDEQARRIVADNEELIISIARNEITTHDVVALGYRRKQLERYEQLLNDEAFFEAERARLNTTPEGLWQHFFEANKWIFGYGLSYVFLSGLDQRKLEQAVRGHSIKAAGKRADAMMKTQALINSLCFVEIKRHTTELLQKAAYRSGVWQPSAELTGGLAQAQGTVHAAVENLTDRVEMSDQDGNPTGEVLFNIEPRSFLVIGNLAEFQTERGPNSSKYRSFELFRRNVKQPEIITFDELFHRAKFIVEHHD